MQKAQLLDIQLQDREGSPVDRLEEPMAQHPFLRARNSPWLRKRGPPPKGPVNPLLVHISPAVAPCEIKAPGSAPPGEKGNKVSLAEKEQDKAAFLERYREAKEHDVEASLLTQQDVSLARWYFVIGCFGLPLMHFINISLHGNQICRGRADFRIKRYVYLSMVVAVLQICIMLIWMTVFQILKDSSLGRLNILNANYDIVLL